LSQFGIIGLTVALIGLIVYFKTTRLNFNLIWIAGCYLLFTIVYATADAIMYLIPVFLCFAIWIGIGLSGLMQTLRRRLAWSGPVLGSVLLFVLSLQAVGTWPKVNASHDRRAEDFCRAVLGIASQDAMVFAKGDEALFSLWYFRYALQERPDLTIISPDLLQFPWYLQTLRYTYPKINFPGPYPFAQTVIEANPNLSICYVQYVQEAEINCLPPISLQGK
jgi:hypothetical protein